MNSFSDYEFRAKVDAALETVRKILDTTKHPARPADVPHVYDDNTAWSNKRRKRRLWRV